MTYADMLREEGELRGELRGLQRGKEEARHGAYVTSLIEFLQSRFGPLPTWASSRLETLDEKTILKLIRQAANAQSLEALLDSLPSQAPSAS